jgi:hypothetical protein
MGEFSAITGLCGQSPGGASPNALISAPHRPPVVAHRALTLPHPAASGKLRKYADFAVNHFLRPAGHSAPTRKPKVGTLG